MERGVIWALLGGTTLLVGGVLFLGWRQQQATRGMREPPATRATESPVMPPRPVHMEVDESQITGERIDAGSFLSKEAPVVQLHDQRAKRAEVVPAPARPESRAKPAKTAKPREQASKVSTVLGRVTGFPTAPGPKPPNDSSGLLERSRLEPRIRDQIGQMVGRAYPDRVHGPELDMAVGDEVLCIAGTRKAEETQIDYLLCRVASLSYSGDPELETFERLDHRGQRQDDAPGCWVGVGQRIQTYQRFIVQVIKAERASAEGEGEPSVLVAKSRRKRYQVEPGELIELLADTVKSIPEGATWKPSRDDVQLQVLEGDGARTLVALDGPTGEVNVALMAANDGGDPRPVCSWKFELVRLA